MAVRLITDTCADLKQDELGEGGILLPIPVFIDGKEYIPFTNLSPEQFYPMQQKAREFPHTAGIPLMKAYEAFKSVVENGDEAVGIFMGSRHSSSFATCVMAKNQLEEDLGEKAVGKIHLVDSQNVTFPEAALVLEAKRLIEEGKMSGKEIAERIEYLVSRIHMRAFIADLFFLKKFGRISAVSATIGTLLNFKVVISTGCNIIQVRSKERGIPHALRCCLDTALKQDYDPTMPTYIGYTSDKKVGEKLMEMVVNNSDFRPARMIAIGATVGAHVGPGSAGFCWFTKDPADPSAD